MKDLTWLEEFKLPVTCWCQLEINGHEYCDQIKGYVGGDELPFKTEKGECSYVHARPFDAYYSINDTIKGIKIPNKVFSKELIKSLQCSDEQIEAAKLKGEKCVYEELGKICTCYLYNGKYYITEVGEEII